MTLFLGEGDNLNSIFMDRYSILFRGYRRDENKEGLPQYCGIYVVYRCTYNNENRTVRLIEMLYIGKSTNVKQRICNHTKRDDFIRQLGDGEELCYSYAEVSKADLDLIENALIFAQKPKLNEDLVDVYRYDSAEFILEGQCALFKYKKFSIE